MVGVIVNGVVIVEVLVIIVIVVVVEVAVHVVPVIAGQRVSTCAS